MQPLNNLAVLPHTNLYLNEIPFSSQYIRTLLFFFFSQISKFNFLTSVFLRSFYTTPRLFFFFFRISLPRSSFGTILRVFDAAAERCCSKANGAAFFFFMMPLFFLHYCRFFFAGFGWRRFCYQKLRSGKKIAPRSPDAPDFARSINQDK